MIIKEHQIPENLVKMEKSDSRKLIKGINNVNFDDHDEIERIILETTSSLISFDTQATETGEFFEAEDFFLQLLQRPIKERGLYVRKSRAYTSSDELRRNFMIIAPGDLSNEVDSAVDIFNSTLDESLIIPKELDRVVIHIHLDTVKQMSGSLSGFDTYYDNLNGEAYGRGANDMKGSAAIIPLLYERLLREGIDMPVLVVTTDEENYGNFGGKRFLKTIRSKILNLDLEPTAGVPGTMVDEIGEAFILSIDDVRLSDQLLNEMQVDLFKRYNYNYYPHMSYILDDLRISINNEGLHMPAHLLKNALLKIAGGKLKNYFTWHQQFNAIKSSINPFVRMKVAKSLLDNYKVDEVSDMPLTTPTRGYKKKLGIWKTPFSILSDNFNCMITIAHPSSSWGIIGPHEAGGGRHSNAEAVRLKDLRMMSDTLFDIIKKLN